MLSLEHLKNISHRILKGKGKPNVIGCHEWDWATRGSLLEGALGCHSILLLSVAKGCKGGFIGVPGGVIKYYP